MKEVICFICGRQPPPTKGRGIRQIMCGDCYKYLLKAFRICYLCRYYKPIKWVGGRGKCGKKPKWSGTQVSMLHSCCKWVRKAGVKLEKHHVTKMLDLSGLGDYDEDKDEDKSKA